MCARNIFINYVARFAPESSESGTPFPKTNIGNHSERLWSDEARRRQPNPREISTSSQGFASVQAGQLARGCGPAIFAVRLSYSA